MPNKDNVQIAPAEGKLGVLIPGMGAVTTTFIAGLEAFKLRTGQADRLAHAIGNGPPGEADRGAQPARLRTLFRWPRCRTSRSGCWDIFEDNAYEAATKAGVLETALLDQVKAAALGDSADEGRLRPELRQAHQRSQHQG